MSPLSPSLIIFGPQGSPPSVEELGALQTWLQKKRARFPWVRDLQNIPNIWNRYVAHTPELGSLDGQSQIQSLTQWINGNGSLPTEPVSGGLLAVPVLVILQLAQYYHFLEANSFSHEQLLGLCAAGSTQGYCTGFLAAAAIASSPTLQELDTNAAAAIYLAIGIGAYSDLMNRDGNNDPNLLTVRLTHGSQKEELVRQVPDVRYPLPRRHVSSAQTQSRFIYPPKRIRRGCRLWALRCEFGSYIK
jgi:hypothetical protein